MLLVFFTFYFLYLQPRGWSTRRKWHSVNWAQEPCFTLQINANSIGLINTCRISMATPISKSSIIHAYFAEGTLGSILMCLMFLVLDRFSNSSSAKIEGKNRLRLDYSQFSVLPKQHKKQHKLKKRKNALQPLGRLSWIFHPFSCFGTPVQPR